MGGYLCYLSCLHVIWSSTTVVCIRSCDVVINWCLLIAFFWCGHQLLYFAHVIIWSSTALPYVLVAWSSTALFSLRARDVVINHFLLLTFLWRGHQLLSFNCVLVALSSTAVFWLRSCGVVINGCLFIVFLWPGHQLSFYCIFLWSSHHLRRTEVKRI